MDELDQDDQHHHHGGTWRLFERVRKRSAGLRVSYVDPTDTAAFAAAITAETKMLWVETPTNPLLKIADLAALAEMGRARGILTVADSTFASPHVQRPLDLGFDIVLHSATKYLNGHSDIVAGVVAVKDADLAQRIGFLQNAVGAVLDQFPSFLALRMERHSANALALARRLENHAKVARVIYPGLDSHPQHQLAARQMNGFGGMVTIELLAGESGVRRFLESLRLFTLAESLGGVESLVGHTAAQARVTFQEWRTSSDKAAKSWTKCWWVSSAIRLSTASSASVMWCSSATEVTSRLHR